MYSTLFWLQDGELKHHTATANRLDYMIRTRNLGVSYMYKQNTASSAYWLLNQPHSSVTLHVNEAQVPDTIRALHLLIKE